MLISLVLLALLAGPAAAAPVPTSRPADLAGSGQRSFWNAAGADPAAAAEDLAAEMSDDELLAQTLFLGWIGTEPSPAIRRWIGDRGIGGVKVFSRNVATLPGLAATVAEMQRLAGARPLGVPLLVATDQEGGWVRHIKLATSIAPGNLALGAAGLPRDAYLTGRYVGRELAALGINMDFAPVADTWSNPEASVIGPRSFGSEPVADGLLSAAWAAGLARAGVIPTAKHYPGHGSADRDSHGWAPSIDVTLDTLLGRDLVPYRMLAREGIPAVMTGHLSFPAILGDETPATLSPFLLGTVLRDRLGFRGIVITDDMEMEGVLRGGLDVPTACRRALEAGCDMLLLSHVPPDQESTWERLRIAMRQESAFRSVVARAARRVLECKLRHLAPLGRERLIPRPSEVAAAVPAPGATGFFSQSAARAVTLVAGEGIPLRVPAGARVLLCGQVSEFLEEGQRRFPAADALGFGLNPAAAAEPAVLARIRREAAAHDLVLFCLANANSLEVLQALRTTAPRIVVVSTLNPSYLAAVPWVRTAVAVYGTGVASFRAGFAVLAGEIAAAGSMPVSFLPGARP